MIRWHLLASMALLMVSTHANSAACTDIFPDPAASHSNNGKITFNSNSQVIGSDGVLEAVYIKDNTRGSSCVSAGCDISGNPSEALNLPRFEKSRSSEDVTVSSWQSESIDDGAYDDIKLNQGSTLTTTTSGGTYYVDKFTLNSQSTVYLASGTYWIETLKLNSNSKIVLQSGASVVLYVADLTLNSGTSINTENDAEPGNLIIIAYDDVKFNTGSSLHGFIYAKDNVTYNSQSTHVGAVSAKEIKFNSQSSVTYAPSSIGLLQADSLCDSQVTPAEPIGQWRFDMCAFSGDSGDLLDNIASNHGSSINQPGILEEGYFCQAGQFRGSGDVVTIPHSEDYEVDEFSVSVWLKTDDLSFSAESLYGGMTVLSKDESGFEGGGHFTLSVTSSGTVQVKQQSSTTSYQIESSAVITEGSWHHLVYTVGSSGMQLYVDNSLVSSSSRFTSGISGNEAFVTLAANASNHTSNTVDVDELSDYFKGELDDLRFYADQLSSAQVSELYGEAKSDCLSCESNAYRVAYWEFDVCSLTGDSGEIVDIENGYNGSTVGNVALQEEGRFCQALSYDGSSYVEVEHQDDFEIAQGTLVFWVMAETLSGDANVRMAVISKDGYASNSDGYFTLYIDGEGSVIFHQETDSQSDEIYSSSRITAGQWYQVAYLWGDDGMDVYLDGVYQGGYSDSSYDWSSNAQPLLFGASGENFAQEIATQGLVTNYFKGEIDDIQLYNGQLSSGEIQELYAASESGCGSCGGVDPLGYYQFEESQWLEDGDVIDSSDFANHGDAINDVSPVLPSSDVSCKAMEVSVNTSSYESVLDTNIDVNDIGGKGTISFWYRANDDWNNGESKMLFDASKMSNFFSLRDVAGFYGYIDGDGRLNVFLNRTFSAFGSFYSEAYTNAMSFGAQDWVHIGLTWNLAADELVLYINGQSTTIHNASSGFGSSFANTLFSLDTLKFGDWSSNSSEAYGSTSSADGFFDDVRIYDYVLSKDEIVGDMQKVTSCTSLDHYEITHPTQALTCSGASIELKACANEACDELSTDPVSVVVILDSSGVSETVTFTGETTVTLASTEAGAETIGVSPQNASSTPANSDECTTDCIVDFVSAGFEFYDATAPYSTSLPDVIAESSLSAIGLRAVQDNEGQCESLLEGEQTISLAYDCVATTHSYSPDVCQVPFAGVATSGDGSTSNAGTVTLTFDANGEATFSGFSYADAGQVALTASATLDDINIESGTATVNSLPSSLVLSTTTSSVNTAGEAFTVTIAAEGASGGALPGYDTSNLQIKLTRVAPTSANGIDAQLVFSTASSVTSALSPVWSTVSGETFTDGTFTDTTSYIEEVGTYQLEVQDSDYLNATINANSVSLGRFVPAYFDVETVVTPSFAPSCSGSFTYLGQSFTYTAGSEPQLLVTAYNRQGQLTKNYADSLWKLSPGSGELSNIGYADGSGYVGSLSLESVGSTPVLSAYTDYNGQGELLFADAQLAFEKIPTPTTGTGNGSAFSLDIDIVFAASVLTDTDDVCYQSSYPNGCEAFTIENVAGSEMRYGRIVLENTYGPETESLVMPVRAEYYNNGGWQPNSDDSCTSIAFTQSSGQLSLANSSSGSDESDLTALLTGIVSVGTLSGGVSPSSAIAIGPAVSNGVALRGAVQLSLEPSASGVDWPSYLNVDWNGDGSIDNDDKPSAEAFFGIHRGNDRTIHMREGY